MKYYFANLAVHVVISLALILLLIIFTQRNRRRKTRHVLTYFLPVIFAALTVAHMARYTAPRLLDITDVIRDNYYSYTGVLDEISSLNNYIVVDGQRYFINPLRELPPKGSVVKVKYSGYSRYALGVSQADTPIMEEK